MDHNRHKLLTFGKAKRQGIQHGKLPIKESGMELTTSAVLTVNHVFDIIAHYLEKPAGSEERWKKALEEAVPERKWKSE